MACEDIYPIAECASLLSCPPHNQSSSSIVAVHGLNGGVVGKMWTASRGVNRLRNVLSHDVDVDSDQRETASLWGQVVLVYKNEVGRRDMMSASYWLSAKLVSRA